MDTQATSPYVLTKFNILGDIARDCPRAAELLGEYGLQCVSCFANEMDTLEQGAKVHMMDETEVDDMIEEINQQLEKEWRETNKK